MRQDTVIVLVVAGFGHYGQHTIHTNLHKRKNKKRGREIWKSPALRVSSLDLPRLLCGVIDNV